MKKYKLGIFLLILVSVLHAQTETTVYWHSPLKNTKPARIGLNTQGYAGIVLSPDNDYLESLRTINPSIIRIMAVVPNSRNAASGSWIDTRQKIWRADTVAAILGAIQSVHSEEIMISIPGWPAWMDRNRDGVLDSDKIAEYAEWCADLVRIVNIDNRLQVRYWTPFVEIEEKMDYNGKVLANLYNQCAQAMKAIDPSILVGGGEFDSRNQGQLVDDFLQDAGKNLDFYAYHQSNSQDYNPLLGIQQELINESEIIDSLHNKLDSLDMKNTPIWITENHIFNPKVMEKSNIAMPDNIQTVFHALVLKHLTEEEHLGGYVINNAFDENPEPVDYRIDMDPLTMLLYLYHKYLTGTAVRTATQRIGQINLLAVDAGNTKNVLVINQTDQYQMVDIRFEGWDQGNCSYLCYTLEDDRVSIDRQLYANGLGNIELGPYSLKLFSFNNLTSVFNNPEPDEIPVNYTLSQPYPNPFNSSSIIQFSVQEQQNVIISLYNASGQLINELFNGPVNANLTYTLQIDGSDLASGQYRVVLLGDDFTAFRSLVYVK